jgi:hypothetical protein
MTTHKTISDDEFMEKARALRIERLERELAESHNELEKISVTSKKGD